MLRRVWPPLIALVVVPPPFGDEFAGLTGESPPACCTLASVSSSVLSSTSLDEDDVDDFDNLASVPAALEETGDAGDGN